jgi:uncharacterized protein (TIGR00255 family)
MTGYGRATAVDSASGAAFTVEIRAVNHRGLDLKIRSGDPDTLCDVEISRVVRSSMERGAITVTIRDESTTGQGFSTRRIRQAHTALESLRRELELPSRVDLATVAAFLSLEGQSSSPLQGPELWRVLEPAVTRALQDLAQMRLREGQSLHTDLAQRVGRLEAIVTVVHAALEQFPDRYARRLTEKLSVLRDLPGYEPGRIAQEVALLADRLDVSEEIVRLRAHLEHLRALLDSDLPVGRKLDFVIQEIGREINTLGSKSQDASVANQVIEAKSELEKIREQAQNIE